MRPYLITAKLMRPSNMKRFPTPALDFILSDVENFLEVHKSICDLFYLKLPSIIQQGTLRKVRKPL
jgi:hypothetical protein